MFDRRQALEAADEDSVDLVVLHDDVVFDISSVRYQLKPKSIVRLQ